MKRILVVEDNDNNRYLLTFLLQHAGYQLLEASDGPSGVRIALAERPDLVLMDIQLPEMDGLEAIRQIRAAERGASLPIVVVSSYAMPGDRDKALAAGADDYIEKPIDPAAVAAKVRKILGDAP